MKANCFFVLSLFAICLSACSDDTENSFERLDGYLYFKVSDNGNWEAITRAERQRPIELLCDAEGQPFYLHTEIVPSMESNEMTDNFTRGNRYTGAVFTNGSINDFGVYGLCSGNTFLNGIQINDAVKDNQVGTVGTPPENVFWYTKEVDFDNTNWPNNSKADFYGFAPYFTPNGGTVNSNGLRIYLNNNIPTIEYQVPTTVTDQLDILTAKHTDVSKNQDVELVFDHILSAIKFNIKNGKSSGPTDKGSMIWNDGTHDYYVTVKSISIKNVYDNGTWAVGTEVYSATPPTWNYSTSTTPSNEFTISPDTDLKNQTAPVEVNPDNSGNVFMMMPQTTPSNAKLEIVCQMDEINNVTSTTVSLYASLAGITWKPGYTYIYSLSLSDFDYVFTIHEDSNNSYNGTETDRNNGTFSNNNTTSTTVDGKDAYKVEIRSYRTDVNGNSEPVQWKAYHSLDGGTTYNAGIPNEWAHLKDNNGTSTALVNADLHIGANATSEDRKFDLVVDEFFVKKDMDLSLYNIDNETRIKRSTANCYIVAEPGIYRIPLIYGNAYNNGAENTASYISNENYLSSSVVGMKNFKNYEEKEIISPYIKTDIAQSGISTTIAGARLVWQDVNNMVTDVSLVTGDSYGDDNRYLQFKVKPANMNYGNAIVAIYDNTGSQNIIWSWHIWVNNPAKFTSENTYTTSRDGVSYYFSGTNLGWVDASSSAIQLEEPRSLKVKLVQEESGRELVFTVNQDGISFTPEHRNAMYQFGRKDPMAGAKPQFNTDAGVNFTTYADDNSHKWSLSMLSGLSTLVDIETTTQNPHIQYVRSGSSYLYHKSGIGTGDSFKNLWNIHSPIGSTNSDQICYGKTIYDPSPVGYRVPPTAAFANFGLGSWDIQTPSQSGDDYYYAVFGNGQIRFPFVGYRDGDNSGNPVDFNKTTYYVMASASPSDLNECQMVRMAIHNWGSAGQTKGFDDAHKGARNRSCQVRAIKDPDGIPERDVDIKIHGDENVKPEESLSRGGSSKW